MELNKNIYAGEVAEWSKAADCKSAGVRLRRFESCPPHNFAGVAQLARASAFQAEGRGFESRFPLFEMLGPGFGKTEDFGRLDVNVYLNLERKRPCSSVGRATPW